MIVLVKLLDQHVDHVIDRHDAEQVMLGVDDRDRQQVVIGK